jgi:hypothetical protein
MSLHEKYTFLEQNLRRARSRENAQTIKIDLNYIVTVGQLQNWKCALTGWDLEFVRGGTYWGGKWCNPMSCTIDRIDNKKGYVIGNVQLVTWFANKTKGHLNDQDFVEMCKSVAKHHA